MAITKIKLKQLENSATIGSIPSTDGTNILTYVAPLAQNHLWGYEHGTTSTLPIIIGTNLSYDAGTNTLNASAGAGGYSDVQEDGAGFTNSNTNTKLNFVGSGLTAADGGSGVTNITVATFLNTLATAGAVNLASHVTGTLPVANGGTGATTLTGLLQGNGTSAITAITNSSTVGQVLRVTGTNTYAWGALDLSDTDAITGDLPFANLAQGSALSVLGVTGNAIADNASIAAGTDHQVLRRSGTALAFGSINLAQSAAVTGILPIGNGGTGSATQNFVDLSNTQSVAGVKTFTTGLKLTSTPSAADDVPNIQWIMDNVAGLKSGSVRVATTAILTATAQTAQTITLGGTSLTIDSISLSNGDTVLVKDSVTGGSGGTFNNGVYVVSGIGSSVVLTRVGWMNTAGDTDGVYVLIQDGTTNVGTLWFTISEVTTLGTDAISFTQITTSGTIGGTAATNKVAYGSASNTLTSTTNFHFESGQLCIGTATLETSNILTTKGSGSGNTTFGHRHLNSSNTKVFSVADNGETIIGSSGELTLNTNGVAHTGLLFIGAGTSNGVRLYGGSAVSSGYSLSVEPSNPKTHTSGDWTTQQIIGNFTPTSGTGTFEQLTLTTTINQTGGANGISRGIWINPTLTAAADYRGLEITSNSSHYAIYTTAGKVRFNLGSDAQGDLLVRGSGGNLERLAAGSTAGHVLTSNGSGAAPSYQAPSGGTKTVGYITGSGTDTYDLDGGVVVLDVDGAAFSFTVPSNVDLVDVYLNGIMLSRSGTVSRDYTLNSGTGVLQLASSIDSSNVIKVVKRV